MALALGSLDLPHGARRSMALRYGHFRGKGAVALGAAFKWKKSSRFDFGVAHGTEHNQTGYSAGVTFTW